MIGGAGISSPLNYHDIAAAASGCRISKRLDDRFDLIGSAHVP
jgi:hypothetical protein